MKTTLGHDILRYILQINKFTVTVKGIILSLQNFENVSREVRI